MSLADGLAAIHLQAPPRVPRTEYSAASHWDLVSAVIGRTVAHDHPPEQRRSAAQAFERAWNYDFRWSIAVHAEAFGDLRTHLGHAAYAAGGSDMDRTVSCPFSSIEQVLAFDPWQAYGAVDKPALVRRFNEHYRANCAANPDAVNMTGIYITLVSGLLEIFGWDLLLAAAGEDPAAFGALADRYAGWIQQHFDCLAACEAPVVMVHDDMVWTSGPFIRPAWYRRHVFPNYVKLFAPLIAAGKRIAYTSDGNFTAFIDDVAACGVHGFVLEPCTDMARIAERYGKSHFFIGNADTRILLSGSRDDIRREVARCMAIGKACPGYFMAVGNHIPANTPVASALWYNQCYEELARR
jgi:hypothetical protein